MGDKGRSTHPGAGRVPAVGGLGHNGSVRKGAVVVALLVAFAAPATASSLPLATRLANALAVPGNAPSASGAVAVDLLTGQTVFARNADTPLAPASNEKLAVTYAALRELGGGYRFRTEIFGHGVQDGAVWHGDLVLKGYGDPTLDGLQLDRLATQIAQLGITHVTGRLLADESWFDSVRTGPGWKASFFINECPPLSALVADRAHYDRHVARQPAIAAAGLLKSLLRDHGVTIGAVGLGRASESWLALAQVESEPLVDVLRDMDRESDNFEAEMLLKAIGAEVGSAGTTAAGVAIVLRDLAADGVPLTGVRMFDGSGLSLDDRFTARALAALLLVAWNDDELHAAIWSALPVAGVNGTLEDRMQRAPARGAVRAKTGTTEHASALSGYVRDRFVFAVLQNGWPVSSWSARKAQDRFATALASAS